MSQPKISAIAISLGIASVVFASQSQVLFRDKESNVTISNYRSFNLKRLAADKTRVVATGSPIIATWSRQELIMRSSKITAVVRQGRNSELELESVDLSDSVTVSAKRASANNASNQSQVIELKSVGAEYRADTNRVNLLSNVVIDRSDPGSGQSTLIKGRSGWAELYRNPVPSTALSGIRSVALKGGVTMKLTSRTVGAGKTVQSVVNGSCDAISYDDKDRQYVLTGNVSIDGNDAILFGKITGNQVIVKLDSRGQIDEIEVTGDPSTSEVGRGSVPPQSRKKA